MKTVQTFEVLAALVSLNISESASGRWFWKRYNLGLYNFCVE